MTRAPQPARDRRRLSPGSSLRRWGSHQGKAFPEGVLAPAHLPPGLRGGDFQHRDQQALCRCERAGLRDRPDVGLTDEGVSGVSPSRQLGRRRSGVQRGAFPEAGGEDGSQALPGLRGEGECDDLGWCLLRTQRATRVVSAFLGPSPFTCGKRPAAAEPLSDRAGRPSLPATSPSWPLTPPRSSRHTSQSPSRRRDPGPHRARASSWAVRSTGRHSGRRRRAGTGLRFAGGCACREPGSAAQPTAPLASRGGSPRGWTLCYPGKVPGRPAPRDPTPRPPVLGQSPGALPVTYRQPHGPSSLCLTRPSLQGRAGDFQSPPVGRGSHRGPAGGRPRPPTAVRD